MFIFLHGYNSNGDAMKILDGAFKKIAPKNSVFLYPDAPFKVINEDNKYCWFPVVLGDNPELINEELVFESMNQAMPYLSNYLKQSLEKYVNFDYKDIILVGFSQGAVFSLHFSLKLKQKLCGVISLSGGLANPDNFISKKNVNKNKILLIHGLNDKILPPHLTIKADKELKQAKFDVETHLLDNTKHLITPEAIKISSNFIKNICNY